MKFLIGLFASISSLIFSPVNKPENDIAVPPLNTAIISFQDTYYTTAVADPDNFPKANSITLTTKNPAPVVVPPPVVQPTPQPPPPPLPPAPIDTGDPYI